MKPLTGMRGSDWVGSLLLALAELSAACGNASSGQDSNAVAGTNAAGANAAGSNAVGAGGTNMGGSAGAGHQATGGAGGSSGPSSGGSSAGTTIQCSANATVGLTTDPEVQRTLQGTNGTFVDSCDAQGNLTDYSCESMQTCTFGNPQPDPLPMCTTMSTGKVVSQTYDCSGHCVNGTCNARCPTFGDLLSYLTVDATTGAATLENQTDHRRYVCQLTFDASGDSYDCKADPSIGLMVKMLSQGLKSSICTGGDFGAFGIGAANALATDPPTCDYECSIAPG